MAVPEGFVKVPKTLFDHLKQHCEECPLFSKQSEASCKQSEETSSKRRRFRASELPRKRKKESADWFWRHVPKTQEWRKRQNELLLQNEQQYEVVIRAFTVCTNVGFKTERCKGDNESVDELVDLAEKFSLLTKSSLSNASLQRSFANFQALIFLSYCLVLREKGIPFEVVDQKIQHITDAREVDRRRLLDGAQHINNIIVDLTNHGWSIFRATELFFLSKALQSMSPYHWAHIFLRCILSYQSHPHRRL